MTLRCDCFTLHDSMTVIESMGGNGWVKEFFMALIFIVWHDDDDDDDGDEWMMMMMMMMVM